MIKTPFSSMAWQKGDRVLVLKDPGKGRVGFPKGTEVEVVSVLQPPTKDGYDYLCKGEDRFGEGAYWMRAGDLTTSATS